VPQTGQIGAYYWGEFFREQPELVVESVVNGLRDYLVGLYALNTAYDSGRLGARVPLPSGWAAVDHLALSPPIDNTAASAWPHSDGGFDEWYFFDRPPTSPLEPIVAFCNWSYSFSLSQWEVVRQTENGFDLQHQLERVQPNIVVGVGGRVFTLSRSRDVVDRFLTLAHEP
jgi:hypothetical protein